MPFKVSKRPADESASDAPPTLAKRIKSLAGNTAPNGLDGSHAPESTVESVELAESASAASTTSHHGSLARGRGLSKGPSRFVAHLDSAEKLGALLASRGSQHKKRDVRVRLNVMDITAIDITSHRFEIKFFLEVSWEATADEVPYISHYADANSVGEPTAAAMDRTAHVASTGDGDDDGKGELTSPALFGRSSTATASDRGSPPMLTKQSRSSSLENSQSSLRHGSGSGSGVFDYSGSSGAPFDGTQFPFMVSVIRRGRLAVYLLLALFHTLTSATVTADDKP
jgi:hypothetical protein